MDDDIVTRLRMWGGDPTTWHSDLDQRIEDGVPQDMLHEAADEIERLSTALALAVGELSTHGEYTAWTPEMLMNQFLEEARRG